MGEILHELGIDPRVIVVHAGAFLLVMYLLNRFFFRPFAGFLDDRRQRIAEQLSEAEKTRRQAQEEVAGLAAQRQEMREQMSQESEQQKHTAREEARRIVEEARRAAIEQTLHAEERMRRELREAQEAVRRETASLATEIARRALARTLGPEEREHSLEAAVRWVEQQSEAGEN